MEANQLWAQSTVKSLAIALPSDIREPQPYGWGATKPTGTLGIGMGQKSDKNQPYLIHII